MEDTIITNEEVIAETPIVEVPVEVVSEEVVETPVEITETPKILVSVPCPQCQGTGAVNV